MNKMRKYCDQSKPINLHRNSHKDLCVPKKIDLLYNTITSEILIKFNFNSIVLFVLNGFLWLVVTVLWWFHLKKIYVYNLEDPFHTKSC